MATTRTRSMTAGSVSGRCFVSAGPWETRSVLLHEANMTDVVGDPHSDHAMVLSYIKTTPALANATGRYSVINSTPTLEKFPVAWQIGAPSHLTLPSLPSIGAMAASVAAKTNPSRPHVQVPVSFFELRELPGLVRKLGSNALKNAGDLHLRHQFGIKPMLSDLRKLLDFQGALMRRLKELENLRKKGGLRRRVELYTHDNKETSSAFWLMSDPHAIAGQTTRFTRRRVWGSCRWLPSDYFNSLKEEELLRLVRLQLLGLHWSQVTQNIWDALPWSWLIDWFSNVGDLLEGSNNSIAHLSGPCCIMTHTETIANTNCYCPSTHPNSVAQVKWAVKSHVVVKGTKRRDLASPLLSASLPFLTGRQLSILGALAAVRYSR